MLRLYLFQFQDEGHSEWVSCVRFSPNSSNPIIVSCGWDKMVKVCCSLSKLFSSECSFNCGSAFSVNMFRSAGALLRFKFCSLYYHRCDVVFLSFLLGVEPGQLQAEDQPHRPHWLPEHSDRVSWWLPVCIWWKGKKLFLISRLQRTVLSVPTILDSPV